MAAIITRYTKKYLLDGSPSRTFLLIRYMTARASMNEPGNASPDFSVLNVQSHLAIMGGTKKAMPPVTITVITKYNTYRKKCFSRPFTFIFYHALHK